MAIKFNYHTSVNTNDNLFSAEDLLKALNNFKAIINDDKVGFFHLTSDHSHIAKAKTIFEKYSERETFVQVGIGGSALGPQMLLDALKKNKKRKFLFLDNTDSEYLHDQLDDLELRKCLFYIVSKSGGTAETMACFAILCNLLLENGVAESDFKNYFVFCTDPVTGDLRELANEFGFDSLEVPPNVGGRFSVLTAVGLLPALFAGIDIEKLFLGANELKSQLLMEDIDGNPLLQTAAHIHYLNSHKNISQTVMMPYSSKLRTFGHWFVQLWGESLGKFSESKERNVGLTPIPAYGATDQHSQMQLFMEGPLDKLLFLIEVKNKSVDFTLQNNIGKKSAKRLAPHSLNQLLDAEFNGTLQALKEQKRDTIYISIERNDEIHLGGLILFFESLTALMGYYLEIDPFNQPGVEKGKLYAYEYLNSLS